MPKKKSTKKTNHQSAEEFMDIVKAEQKDIAEVKANLSHIAHLLQTAGFGEFIRYLKSPWRIMVTNFFAGVFRGLGILLGMTVVVALIIWALTKVIDFPLIGEYLNEWLHIQEILNLLKELAPNGTTSSLPQIGVGN